MSFGSQTVTFIAQTPSGTPGRLGVQPLAPTGVDVPECRHRPLTATEQAEQMTNVASQVWKTTAPPEAAAAAAKSTGLIVVDGVTYKIVGGAKPFEDYSDPFKVTIYSEIFNG